MDSLWRDIRYGLRTLLKRPGFTVTAVLSLALGIGANTTIFTVINAVFLQPLPVAEPSRLVSVYGTDANNVGGNLDFLPISQKNYEDYRDRNQSFSGLVAFAPVPISLSSGDQPEELRGLLVTGNYFDVLGVKPAYGRTFLPEEDRTPGTHPVVVVSHGLWQRRFGGVPDLVGKTVTLNNQSFTVIGIAPRTFKGTSALENIDVWIPNMMHDQVLTGTLRTFYNLRRALMLNAIGRLKPEITLAQGAADMKNIASQLEQEYPKDNEKRSVTFAPLTESTINPSQRSTFALAGILLMTIVGFILLIACANVANLLTSRAIARRSEIALRLALGCSRGRLIRQLMVESLLLALMGGALGLLVAVAGRSVLWSFIPPFLAQAGIDISLDLRVLGFTLLLSLITGVIFGLVPTLQASKPDLVAELKDRTAQPRGSRGFSLRNILVVAQVALSIVSLIGAGLFIRSLRNAVQINPGFETQHLLLLSFNVAAQGYDENRGQEFYRQVVQRIETVSGVKSASEASRAPLAGGIMRSVFIEGQDAPTNSRGTLVIANAVGLKYFETLGISLLRGRNFSEGDRDKGLRVAIINEAMARRFWPSQDPLTQSFKFFGTDASIQIVGVVTDSKLVTLGENSRPCVYLPLLQNYSTPVTLYVRTLGDPVAVLGTVRREMQTLEPNLPLGNASTMPEIIDQALWAPRITAVLLAIFGLLGLVLAAIGIYGILVYSVNQRSREIGIRMALGAQRRDILRLVVGEGMLLVIIGIALGLVASFVATRFIVNLLFGVSATDPIVFSIVALLLALVALFACYIPARKATKVDPLLALRAL